MVSQPAMKTLNASLAPWSLVFGLVLFSLISCRSQDVASDAVSTAPTWKYFDGAAWQVLTPALDRLQVERRRIDKTDNKADETTTSEIIMLKKSAQTVAELESVAQQMQQAQSDIVKIHGFIVRDGQSRRLTGQVLVQFSSDDVRVAVEKKFALTAATTLRSPLPTVAYNTPATLFSSLKTASLLQQESGVVYAMPQYELDRVRR
jgi:hypothetical protein